MAVTALDDKWLVRGHGACTVAGLIGAGILSVSWPRSEWLLSSDLLGEAAVSVKLPKL